MSNKGLQSGTNFRKGAFWIFLIVGILLYAIGFFLLESLEFWKEVAMIVGEVLAVGGAVGYLTKITQDFGMFKEELQDVIYGKEFLDKRNDLPNVWENLSKIMFKNKFPKIHGDLLKTIKGYLPKDDVSYYRDYDIDATIEWADRASGKVKVTENISYELIADAKINLDYDISTWSPITDQNECTCTIKDLTINGQAPKNVTAKNYIQDGNLYHTRIIKLKGSNTYSINFVREKIYNIYEDYFLGFQARYIAHGLKVTLEHPEDIDVSFIERGTQEKYTDRKLPSNKKISKQYKGIILPKQGYIIALMPKAKRYETDLIK